MENKAVKTIISAIALSSAAVAGPEAGSVESVIAPIQSNTGNFCETWKNMGKLYKNNNNPFIQQVKVFGRAHIQYANINGENAAGNDISESYDELRRFRAGIQVKAFNGLEIFTSANFTNDQSPRGGDRDIEFTDYDQAYIAYNFGTLAGIDDLKLSYGRFKIALSAEGQDSSKTIKTVERTAISNKVFTNRYTSFLVSGSRGNVDATFGFLSLDDTDFIGTFDVGHALYFDTTVGLGGHDYHFDALYNIDEGTADDEVGMDFEYAASLATSRTIAGWDTLFNVIYGNNGDNGGAETGGAFWGVVVQPSKYIIDDKLEAVFRYSYQGSSRDQGISSLRRYFGQSLRDNPVAGDNTDYTGDSHHSIYAGLNYHLCGHNSKILLGAEYETIETPNGSSDASTLWAAYRVYF